jgi:hypothetical protein
MSDDLLKALSTKARFRFLTEYMAQMLFATACAIISGFVIAMILDVIAMKIRGLPERGSFPDVFGEPYFIGPIALAFALGLWGRKRFRTTAGYFLWIVPALILLSSFLSWHSYSHLGRWQDAWANFFGRDCGGSECFYEWTVTAPFYTSVVYTLGWIVARKSENRSAAVHSRTKS